ncbi:hypothetical protein CTA1_13008 [Colletotrichum tanaceti]|uniref:Uncharacterized protein n=1 Tax=Colletotrichum tanaceti TaxID=1306861 RepID=A0A4U6X773_9PEZI|nr:hypothetical protein CTA1_13008 [Colletotrichum tanaceti]
MMFHGPWYAASFSICSATISHLKLEPQWLMFLAKRYNTAALKDIYWDPKCNTKRPLYGTGALGPPQIFSTIDGNDHRALRKALDGPQESLRLNPPAPNLFARVAPSPGGKVVGGTWVPPGAEMTSNANVVQRDPRLYAPDPGAFRPERWLLLDEEEERAKRGLMPRKK